MAEAITITLFMIILIPLTIMEQKEIVIEIRNKLSKKIGSVLLSLLVVSIFWTDSTATQVKLIIFAMLILILGFTKEGFGQNKIVKMGLLNASYDKYSYFEIGEISNKMSRVTLYKDNKQSTSVLVEENLKKVEKLLLNKGLLLV